MRAWILLVALLGGTVTGCAPSAEPPPSAKAAAPAATPSPSDLLRQSTGSVAFAFAPPDGWEVRDIPGLKFQVIAGPPSDGFAPNVNIVDETFPGSLDDYVKANRTQLAKAFPTGKMQEPETFTTDSGVEGRRMQTENPLQDKRLRQTFYFFGKGDTKLVVTCSTLAGAPQDAVFDKSMKSFRFE